MNKFIPKNYKYKKIRKRVRANKLTDYRTSSLKTFKFGLKLLDNGVISVSYTHLDVYKRQTIWCVT